MHSEGDQMQAIRQYVLTAWGRRLSEATLEQLPRVDAGAGALAMALRCEGIPVQCYRLANADRVQNLVFPFIAESDREWVVSDPGNPYRGVAAPGRRARVPQSFPVNRVLVAEPPMGEAFFLGEDSACASWSTDIEAAVFYLATEADTSSAADQLVDDLECLVEDARTRGREVLYFDFLGELPSEVMRLIGGGGEGFRLVMEALRLRLSSPRLVRGQREDARSPVWDGARRAMEQLGVEVLREVLDSSLMTRYISLCRDRSAQAALAHLAAGQLEQAAAQMGSFLEDLHRLDCGVRAEASVRRIKQVASERGRPMCILAVRGIDHYGVLERLLSDQGVDVRSKILGAGRFAPLTGASMSQQTLDNLDVSVSAEERRAIALRECLKHVAFAYVTETQGIRALLQSLAEFRMDGLRAGRIESLVNQLQAPSRVYLRSHPYNQGVQEQLVYMLRAERILPEAWIRDPADLIDSGGEADGTGSKK